MEWLNEPNNLTEFTEDEFCGLRMCLRCMLEWCVGLDCAIDMCIVRGLA